MIKISGAYLSLSLSLWPSQWCALLLICVFNSFNVDGVIVLGLLLLGGKFSQAKRTSEIVTEAVNGDEVNLPVVKTEPWTILAHKKPQKGWIPYNPRTMRPPPLTRDTKYVKLMSWNVNGLRALLKLEGFSALQLAQREDFDVLCLQETKLQASL